MADKTKWTEEFEEAFIKAVHEVMVTDGNKKSIDTGIKKDMWTKILNYYYHDVAKEGRFDRSTCQSKLAILRARFKTYHFPPARRSSTSPRHILFHKKIHYQ